MTFTFFAFGSYKVNFTFANVRSKEWRANSTIHAFGLWPSVQQVFIVVIAWRTDVSRYAARIFCHFHQILDGVSVDDDSLQGTVEAGHDAGLFVE